MVVFDMGQFGQWTVYQLDGFEMTQALVHMLICGLWVSTPNSGSLSFWMPGMCFLYPFQILFRIRLTSSFDNFINNPTGDVRFANRLSINSVAISAFCAMMYLADVKPVNCWRAGMSVQFTRLLVLEEDFRLKAYSLIFALRPLVVYAVLLCVCFLEYALMGYYFFKGAYTDPVFKRDPFGSLTDSGVTFTHLTFGDWTGTITPIANATNMATIWFFASYILLVAVLFANLFIGIIISFQRTASRQLTCCSGRCLIKFGQELKGLREAHQREIIYMVCKIEAVRSSVHQRIVESEALQEKPNQEGMAGGRIAANDFALGLVQCEKQAAAITIQSNYRRFKDRRTMKILNTARVHFTQCNVIFSKVIQLIELAHRKADFNNDGTLDDADELSVACKFLVRIFGLQSSRIKYLDQWLDFAVSNTLTVRLQPMSTFRFAAWFFRNFLLEGTMEFTIALPLKFFYQDDGTTPPGNAHAATPTTGSKQHQPQQPEEPNNEEATRNRAARSKEAARSKAKDDENNDDGGSDNLFGSLVGGGQGREGGTRDVNHHDSGQRLPLHGAAHALIRQLFTRYDLDDSGDLNSDEELQQLTTNIIFRLDTSRLLGALVYSQAEVLQAIADAPTLSNENAWNVEKYIEWFGASFPKQFAYASFALEHR
jgi:hypothetical protein